LPRPFGPISAARTDAILSSDFRRKQLAARVIEPEEMEKPIREMPRDAEVIALAGKFL
jgi:hypothetical protein